MSGLLGALPPSKRLAQEWRDRVARIARNLTDFNDSEACVRVKARMDDASRSYRGKTKIAALEALGALDALWQDYLLLSRVVDEADALAKRSGLLAHHDAEVVALLTSASIKLPAVSIPVQQRGLLDTPEREGKVAPDEVLGSMMKAFDLARLTINEIDEAETRVGASISSMRAAVEEVRTWRLANEFDGAEAGVPALDDVSADPLGALDRLRQAEVAVASMVRQNDELRAQRAALDQGLARARARLPTLRASLEPARTARDEIARRFAAVIAPLDPRTEAAPVELEAWLETLAAANNRARPKATLVGLGKWEEAFAARCAAARGPVDALRRMIAEQEDISGRLRALRAKGAHLATTRAPPSALAALEDQAKTEARRVPFRAAAANAAVKAYEDALLAFARTK